MIIVKILLGLVGLGVVVFVHELGHFLAARAMGIEVEAFSIGWGKAFLKKKIGGVEYRLGVFPLGGYCKMKGENDLRDADENGEFVPQPGGFYAAHPLRRIITAFAGPFFNILFAIAVFSVIWGVGFETPVLENRIILVSDISGDTAYPANVAGLQTGDRIIEIDGKPCENYADIQQTVALNPGEALPFTVIRDNKIVNLTVTPNMDRETATGKIGVYFWTDPVIGRVVPDSPAAHAGLLAGDRITKMADEDFPYSAAITKIFAGFAEREESSDTANAMNAVSIEWERADQTYTGTLDIPETGVLGLEWQLPVYKTPHYGFFGAIAKGATEAGTTLAASVKSLTFFFKGIDFTKAVSGPVRITYMVGDVAASGFAESASSGLRSSAEFLAFISIALCVMNLLPLPILDGGLILLFLIEIIRRRPVPTRMVAVFQTFGVVLIGGLMLFALFGDILFLVNQG
ncbi:MAG: site-2 protease family protein [Spirochaetaceae bacterium]|jgi:regulator of sigma E protease|nr:site-2 protease family protein [Spirochaetaceae bacterium]